MVTSRSKGRKLVLVRNIISFVVVAKIANSALFGDPKLLFMTKAPQVPKQSPLVALPGENFEISPYGGDDELLEREKQRNCISQNHSSK